jgi:hypothetical protein
MVKKFRFAPMKRNLSISFILILFFSACSTDFDVIAPYKEIMVIDGLLNADDSVQYIRISKAFLGEGNAYVMAQQKDSVNYADVLDVTIERSGVAQETFPLTRNELDNKDSGIFAYPFHLLYSTNHPILDDGSLYKIIVKNRETGVTAFSQTKIVKKISRVTSPLPLPSPSGDSIDLATAGNAPAYIIYEPGSNSNAQVFDAVIRFHYREIDPSGNSKQYYIDFNFPDKISTVTPSEINYRFYKYDLFNNIGYNIPDKAGYTRRTDSLSPAGLRPFQYILIEGTEDLQTYSQLQHPSSSSVIDEPPTFTTVVNGLGLFSSRLVHSMYYFPNAVTEAAFDTATATKNKNFKFD